MEKVLDSNHIQIDVSSLAAGTYIASAYTHNGDILKKKLIKIK